MDSQDQALKSGTSNVSEGSEDAEIAESADSKNDPSSSPYPEAADSHSALSNSTIQSDSHPSRRWATSSRLRSSRRSLHRSKEKQSSSKTDLQGPISSEADMSRLIAKRNREKARATARRCMFLCCYFK